MLLFYFTAALAGVVLTFKGIQFIAYRMNRASQLFYVVCAVKLNDDPNRGMYANLVSCRIFPTWAAASIYYASLSKRPEIHCFMAERCIDWSSEHGR